MPKPGQATGFAVTGESGRGKMPGGVGDSCKSLAHSGLVHARDCTGMSKEEPSVANPWVRGLMYDISEESAFSSISFRDRRSGWHIGRRFLNTPAADVGVWQSVFVEGEVRWRGI